MIVDFFMVKVSFSYNAIIGKPSIRMTQAVMSTYRLMIKFLIDNRVGEIKGDQAVAEECYFNNVRDQGW